MAEPAEVVAEVRKSRRYRSIAEELVERLARTEAASAPDHRGAVKAVKRKLHQVVGAFGGATLARGLPADLAAACAAGDRPALQAACLRVLSWHASTRERISILPDFYRRVFALTGTPRVILDLGCGLGPLALPWTGLPIGTAWHAYDADEEIVGFVNAFFLAAGLPALVEIRDVVARPPSQSADVAFLLKLLPTLEQQSPGSGRRVLDALDSPFVVLSYPVRSLGGRDKGMVRHFEGQVRAVLEGGAWEVERLLFATELVYVLSGRGAAMLRS